MNSTREVTPIEFWCDVEAEDGVGVGKVEWDWIETVVVVKVVVDCN